MVENGVKLGFLLSGFCIMLGAGVTLLSRSFGFGVFFGGILIIIAGLGQ